MCLHVERMAEDSCDGSGPDTDADVDPHSVGAWERSKQGPLPQRANLG
jgi:hypothetical protein